MNTYNLENSKNHHKENLDTFHPKNIFNAFLKQSSVDVNYEQAIETLTSFIHEHDVCSIESLMFLLKDYTIDSIQKEYTYQELKNLNNFTNILPTDELTIMILDIFNKDNF